MRRTALVVGVTGIAGYNIAQALAAEDWKIVGLSRTPRYEVPGVDHVYADVSDPAAVERALAGRDVSHVFFATWSRQATEAENCRVNAQMLRSALTAAGAVADLEHVTLITGLKHYLGPFEAYASAPAETPFRESQPRLEFQNFYYEQEDVLFEESARQGFTWSVLRPHTLIGFALGNVMNMGVTLAVYASICRATGEPFVFPGSPEQYNGVTDLTDARLLGRHALWSATEPRARNEAFNSVNGEVFRWRQMWREVAAALGVEAAEYPGHPTPLQDRMGHADGVWEQLARQHGLAAYRASDLAPWWHTDADLGRTVETFADMSKARQLGFLDYQDTAASFADLFEDLRARTIIPPLAGNG
jgi:nucleoside-diphosphate-sugar epimerase